jgi:hypothetical protein
MPTNRLCFSRQHEKRRLKGILGVVRVAQHSLANSQHHRPVSRHQFSEGFVVTPQGEPPNQLAIGWLPHCGGAGWGGLSVNDLAHSGYSTTT